MSNPLLKENDLHLQKAIPESEHPDFEEGYQGELIQNLDGILKERYPQLKS